MTVRFFLFAAGAGAAADIGLREYFRRDLGQETAAGSFVVVVHIRVDVIVFVDGSGLCFPAICSTHRSLQNAVCTVVQ